MTDRRPTDLPTSERSVGGREYVLAFGPADPEAKRGFVQVSVHQCIECAALVVEDFMPEHERWHAALQGRSKQGPPQP